VAIGEQQPNFLDHRLTCDVIVPETTELFRQLGLALLLGLLVGFQRERVGSTLAGVRTFPMITLLGAISALLAITFDAWILAAAFLAVGGVTMLGATQQKHDRDPDIGTTTEFAVLLMFAVGALTVVAPALVAVAIGATVAVLLQFKPELHGLVARVGDNDFREIMRFVLIACIILPVLPNQTYGPLQVLNPFEIWLMVVLIVGISLSGYIIYKFFGQGAGVIFGGILGGAISSTATTVSYARRAAEQPERTKVAAAIIAIASAVAMFRVLLEVTIVAPAFLRQAAPPLLITLLAAIVPLVALWLRPRSQSEPFPELKNPSELRTALTFGALYAAVIWSLSAVKEYLHGGGMYAVAVLSGLTDMDAITLSTSRLVQTEHLDGSLGWRLILAATISNLVFKATLVAILGQPRLLKRIVAIFSIPAVVALLLIWLWPDIQV